MNSAYAKKQTQTLDRKASTTWTRYADEVNCPICESDKVQENITDFSCLSCGIQWKTKNINY